MPTIGTIECTFVKGTAAELKERVEAWQRPGIDGYGAQTVGKGDAPFAFTAVLYDTQENVESWIADLEALQGQVIDVTDDWGREHASLLVLRVTPVGQRLAAGSGGCRGEVRIEGVRTA
jgi:hypothetical protein